MTTPRPGAGTFADLGGIMMGATGHVVRADGQPRRLHRLAPEQLADALAASAPAASDLVVESMICP